MYYLVLFLLGICIMHYYSGYVTQAEYEYEHNQYPTQSKIVFGMIFVISGMMLSVFSILHLTEIAEKIMTRINLKEVKQNV